MQAVGIGQYVGLTKGQALQKEKQWEDHAEATDDDGYAHLSHMGISEHSRTMQGDTDGHIVGKSHGQQDTKTLSRRKNI